MTEMRDLMTSWSGYIEESSCIFIRTPKHNRSVLIGDAGSKAPFERGDPRLRDLPFPTRRPTLKEVTSAHARLATIYVGVAGGGSPGRKREGEEGLSKRGGVLMLARDADRSTDEPNNDLAAGIIVSGDPDHDANADAADTNTDAADINTDAAETNTDAADTNIDVNPETGKVVKSKRKKGKKKKGPGQGDYLCGMLEVVGM